MRPATSASPDEEKLADGWSRLGEQHAHDDDSRDERPVDNRLIKDSKSLDENYCLRTNNRAAMHGLASSFLDSHPTHTLLMQGFSPR